MKESPPQAGDYLAWYPAAEREEASLVPVACPMGVNGTFLAHCQ
jgi:hypothetical protein